MSASKWTAGGEKLARGSCETQVFFIKRFMAQELEAAGIAPASREPSMTASPGVVDHWIVGLKAPFGTVPIGFACQGPSPERDGPMRSDLVPSFFARDKLKG